MGQGSAKLSNKRKNLGSSVTTRRKNWERITILGAFGVISEIQRAKFGVFVTYIFGGQIWGSYWNFKGKFWGQAPPRPPYMEVTPLGRSPSVSYFLDLHKFISVYVLWVIVWFSRHFCVSHLPRPVNGGPSSRLCPVLDPKLLMTSQFPQKS